MVGWHHQLDGHEFEWTPGIGDGQGGLACCSSWECKKSDMTEWLNWTQVKKRTDRKGTEKVGWERGNKVNQETYSLLIKNQGKKGKGIHLVS